MRIEDIVKEWVELGKQDLATAQFLLTMRPVPLEIVGFLSQQSVEKHLKAFLIQNGQEPAAAMGGIVAAVSPGIMITDFARDSRAAGEAAGGVTSMYAN